MPKDWKGLTLVVLGGSALALAVFNTVLYRSNNGLQVEVAQRQIVLNQAEQLGKINTGIIKALAQLAAETQDNNLRRVLADYGVTFKVNQKVEK